MNEIYFKHNHSNQDGLCPIFTLHTHTAAYTHSPDHAYFLSSLGSRCLEALVCMLSPVSH